MNVVGERAHPGAARFADAAERYWHWASARHLPLIAIYLIAAAVAVKYALQVDTWKVQTDELQYERLAISVGDGPSLVPTVRGASIGGYNFLYPWLLAPIYAVFSTPVAFKAAHAMNALVMVSAVFPTYLIARGSGLSRTVSYLAAALAVSVPWLSESTALLTEVAAFPAFLWAIAAMQHTLVRPGPRSDLLVVAALTVAFLARTQFVVLALLLPIAIVANEIGFRALSRPRPPIRRALAAALRAAAGKHRVLIGAYVLTVLATLFLVSGGFNGLLGSYVVTANGDLFPPGTASTAGINLDIVAVAIGVIPLVLAVAWCATSLVRPRGGPEYATAILIALVVAVLAFVTASYDLRFAPGFIQERYFFYVAPLLFVGMLQCLAGGRRPWVLIGVSGAAVAAMLSLTTFQPAGQPLFASPSAAFYNVIHGRTYQLGQHLGFSKPDSDTVILIVTVVAAGAIAVGVRHLRPVVVTGVVGLAVLGYCVVETLYVLPRAADAGTGGTYASRVPIEKRDWIDRVVPSDASVAIVPGSADQNPTITRIAWWDAEFWNKRVDRSIVYEGASDETPFTHGSMTLDPRSGALRPSTPSQYLVVPDNYVRFRPAGKRTFQDPGGSLALVEADRPYRAEWAALDASEDGWTQKNPARIRFFPDPKRAVTARRVTVVLSLPPAPPAPRRHYRLEGPGRTASGEVSTGQASHEQFLVCMPRGQSRDLRLSVGGRLSSKAERFPRLRILSIQGAPAPLAACGATDHR